MEKKTLIMWLSRLKNSMKAHPDYFTGINQEFVDYVEGAEKVLEQAEKEQATPQGIGWVKASERLPLQSGRVTWRWLDKAEAYSGYDEKKGFIFGTGGARVDPTYYSEIEWLDEGQPRLSKQLLDFIRDVATNWDCDVDGHKYNTGCRKCSASELLYDLTRNNK